MTERITEEQLAKWEVLADESSRGPLHLVRYEHGGGRMAMLSAEQRTLIADTYHQGDREFFLVARCVALSLIAEVRRLHTQLDWLTDSADEDAMRIAGLEHDHALAVAERDTMADTLTRAQARGTELLERARAADGKLRKLKAKTGRFR